MENGKKILQGIGIVCAVAVAGYAIFWTFVLFILTSKPNPRKLAQASASLIPYIEEVRPFVEENWERMDQVRLIEKNREETDEPLTEEEQALVDGLFTEDCPFTYVYWDSFYTRFGSDNGIARLYVMYFPDSEWDVSQGIDRIYYMEELAPEWYACTEPIWYGNNSPISFDELRAEREDGGRVRLPREASGGPQE